MSSKNISIDCVPKMKSCWKIHVSVRVALVRGALSHDDHGNCASYSSSFFSLKNIKNIITVIGIIIIIIVIVTIITIIIIIIIIIKMHYGSDNFSVYSVYWRQ